MAKRKLLLVGWDAADWKVIHPLMDQGLMPNLKRLVSGGVMANLRTLHPVLSPMLWTSIATGKRPYEHGILGFIEPTPDGLHVRPVTNLSRKTKAVWNILNQNGFKTNVVGWWPSHPAETIDGVMVSDLMHKVPSTFVEASKWPMAEATVYPPRLYKEIKSLRMHPGEMTADILLNFIPLAAKVDQKKDPRLQTCIKIICELTSVHAAATHIMETEPWDFMAVYYDAIDHFSHGFMKYHPPQVTGVSNEEFEIYQHVITSAYIFHDMMLGRLLELAGSDATVIVMSDHGFHSDHLRPRYIPAEPAGPAVEHRDHGIFVMHGPDVRHDELLFGLNLLDVAPTVLHAFGIPVGEDFDGHVIDQAFVDFRELPRIQSWDLVGPAPTASLASVTVAVDHEETQRALQQLVELGYIGRLDEDKEKVIRGAISEQKFNLARSYMDAGLIGDALPILAGVYRESPGEYRYGIQFALCLKAMGQLEDLEKLVKQLNERRILDASNATTKLSKYSSIMRQRRSDFLGNHPESNEPGMTDLFAEEELKELLELRAKANLHNFALDFLEGYVLVSQKRFAEGIRFLRRAIQSGGPRPSFYGMLGEALLGAGQINDAEQAIDKGLSLDPHSSSLLLCKAIVFLRRKKANEAADLALQSIANRYFQPHAHYVLGSALHRLNRLNDAMAALKVCVSQNPNFFKAHTRMSLIERQRGNQAESLRLATLADELRERNKNLRVKGESLIAEVVMDPVEELRILPERFRPTRNTELLPILGDADLAKLPENPTEQVVVVTGLPRSGTSMMMQMLQAGGMDAFTDHNRAADEDNPEGYLELEQVKHLNADNSFMLAAQGKVLKVVAPLIPYLPAELGYRVIYLDRDFDEIIASQKKMLRRQNKPSADMDDDTMRLLLARQSVDALKVLNEKRVPVLRVPYRAVVENSAEAARRISVFLQLSLDQAAMVGAIKRDLYRNRANATKETR
ncbi:MAG: alkaline phosphatase family protein [Pirellulaceae bacterium]